MSSELGKVRLLGAKSERRAKIRIHPHFPPVDRFPRDREPADTDTPLPLKTSKQPTPYRTP